MHPTLDVEIDLNHRCNLHLHCGSFAQPCNTRGDKWVVSGVFLDKRK